MSGLREALESAFDSDESTEKGGGSEKNTKEPVGSAETGEEEGSTSGEPEGQATEEADEGGAGGDGDTEEEEGGAEGEGDDDLPAAASAEGEEDDDSDESGGADVDPPRSWKPLAREHWAKLPKEVRNEVTRREMEVQRALSSTIGARKVADAFQAIVEPYRHIIAASGSNPMQATQRLLQTAAGLRVGTPAQKAELVVSIINEYGVDIKTLDASLAKTVDPNAAPRIDPNLQAMLEQQLGPVKQFMTTMERERQQTQQNTKAEVESAITEFGKNHPFFEDLRDDMADVVDLASKRGQNLTLQEAYDRAVTMRPDIQKILAQRTNAAAAESGNGSSRAKRRRAAKSISGSPSAAGGGVAPTTLRDSLEAAWDGAE